MTADEIREEDVNAAGDIQLAAYLMFQEGVAQIAEIKSILERIASTLEGKPTRD